jgi:hypothetical protein
MWCRFSGHCFDSLPRLRKRSLCLAELLSLPLCSQRISCPAFQLQQHIKGDRETALAYQKVVLKCCGNELIESP